eukprot:scaffold1911_cov397-Prasinococcus_capsulatus_cf.AAC.25
MPGPASSLCRPAQSRATTTPPLVHSASLSSEEWRDGPRNAAAVDAVGESIHVPPTLPWGTAAHDMELLEGQRHRAVILSVRADA